MVKGALKNLAFSLSCAWIVGCAGSSGEAEWPMWGGRPDRNWVSGATSLPVTWGAQSSNILWIAELGTIAYGCPSIQDGRIFIGTNNGKPRNPAIEGDRGIVMCLSATDGKFLWQAVHDKLSTGDAEDWKGIGICSTPCVAGNRVYYVSNRAELVCCDAEGFLDGENDGPVTSERLSGKEDADFVWMLDMRRELGVSPYQASASSPLVVGDLVFVLTGQGSDHESDKVKNPQAPSFIAVHRETGRLVWKDASPGEKIFSGQWGSPAYGMVNGKPQVAFPGGDGWLYAFEPASGTLLWKFNCKAHEEGKPKTTDQLIATPVYAGHRVLIATGRDTEHYGPGCLRAIDARGRGDVTKTAELWKWAHNDFGCSISNATVYDGLVYAVEIDGFLNCIELETGRRVWRHDLQAMVWGSPLAADGRIYVQTADGEVVVFAAGRELRILAKNSLPHTAHGTPVALGRVLYVVGESRLYAIGSEK